MGQAQWTLSNGKGKGISSFMEHGSMGKKNKKKNPALSRHMGLNCYIKSSNQFFNLYIWHSPKY